MTILWLNSTLHLCPLLQNYLFKSSLFSNNLPVSFNAYPKCIFMALLHSPYLRYQTWIRTQWTTASTLSISLKENQTYCQMWHSEQMLLLKEHWSSSLVQHNPPQLQGKTGSIPTENKTKNFLSKALRLTSDMTKKNWAERYCKKNQPQNQKQLMATN